MREKLLKNLAKVHEQNPWRMIILVIILTVIFMGLAGQLTMTSRWTDLLPARDIRTTEFNKILEEFVSANSIVVVVQGDEDRMKAFAEDITPRIEALKDTTQNEKAAEKIKKLQEKLAAIGNDKEKVQKLKSEIEEQKSRINKPLVQRVDYKIDVDFIKDHGLMLIKADDLRNLQEIFTDPNMVPFLTNINNSLEKEYVGRAESISTRQKEDQAVMFLDGLKDLTYLLKQYGSSDTVGVAQARRVVDKLLYGEPYMLSYDKSTLVLVVIPNFTLMDVEYLIRGTDLVQNLVDEGLKNYPELSGGLTGMIPIGRDEMVYSQQSLHYTSFIAFIAILIMLVLSFRMWSAPLLAGLNLIVGLIWATGMAALLVGQLNFMTSMFAIILIGLGIDFSIHIISGFSENRALGRSIGESLSETLLKSGKGIITGGLTTSVAFLSLTISQSRGMKEMGVVTGAGLLTIMLGTFLLLPALLVLRERRLEKKQGETHRAATDISFKFLGKSADWLSKRYIFTLLAAVALTAVLIISAFNITFDHNYMNMEPKGLTSIALQDTILDKYDMGMDYGLILTESIRESDDVSEKLRNVGTVAIIDDISTYLPSAEEQKQRRPYLEAIRDRMIGSQIGKVLSESDVENLVQELERLEMNVIELQDMAFMGGQDKVFNKCIELVGDPRSEKQVSIFAELVESLETHSPRSMEGLVQFQRQASPYFKSAVLRMSNTDRIELGDLPESIMDRYSNRSRDKFLVTVYPAGDIWKDARFLERFADDLSNVTPKATGMPPVFRALIDIIGQDGKNAAMLTILLMFLLLWLDFRNLGYALIALIPLAVGAFWMVGLMHLVGQQLTVMNVMGIPLIIGIGIDDGVHIMHRWLSEGKKKLRIVFASTGKAILLTSMTTMLGFGSLVFSIWRGFAHLGSALFIGVAACFLTTVIILPAILGWLQKRKS